MSFQSNYIKTLFRKKQLVTNLQNQQRSLSKKMAIDKTTPTIMCAVSVQKGTICFFIQWQLEAFTIQIAILSKRLRDAC